LPNVCDEFAVSTSGVASGERGDVGRIDSEVVTRHIYDGRGVLHLEDGTVPHIHLEIGCIVGGGGVESYCSEIERRGVFRRGEGGCLGDVVVLYLKFG
tara:strand:- start:1091 stop:1384 length:294 start_codon:yes stop_codon:yes gene_type:complete